MAGLSLPTAGGALGPAANTVWFGAIPDRMNMLLPKHMDSVLSVNTPDSASPANFLNQWTMYNESYAGGSNIPLMTLGGFTTAPDGTTNTAQLLVETTANSQHFCQAGCLISVGTRDAGWFRIAVFVKYAGRRIVLAVTQQPQSYGSGIPNNVSGARAVFDLAGGQVGVQPNVVDLSGSFPNQGAPDYQVSTGTIIPYPNGFYLCYYDVHISCNGAAFLHNAAFVWLMLDNGTGTAAESSTYAGDGVSGVYGWRSNLMPDRAWGMSGAKVFFDDLLSFSNWDTTNSKAPGFTWYIDSSTPNVPLSAPAFNLGPTPLADLSITSSVLTISGAQTGGKIDQVMSAACTTLVAPTTFVGNTFQFPALFEGRISYNYAAQTPGSSVQASIYIQDLTFKANQPFQANPTYGVPNFNIVGREFDFFEAQAGGANALVPRSTTLRYEQNFGGGNFPNVGETIFDASVPIGLTVPWISGGDYTTGSFVFNAADGNYYTSLQNLNRNNPPATSPTWWSLGPTGLGHIDLSQFHIYQNLVFPSQLNRPGQYLVFMDGAYCCLSDTWAPAPTFPGGTMETSLPPSDGHLFPILLFTQSGMSMSVDWVSVTQ